MSFGERRSSPAVDKRAWRGGDAAMIFHIDGEALENAGGMKYKWKRAVKPGSSCLRNQHGMSSPMPRRSQERAMYIYDHHTNAIKAASTIIISCII